MSSYDNHLYIFLKTIAFGNYKVGFSNKEQTGNARFVRCILSTLSTLVH